MKHAWVFGIIYDFDNGNSSDVGTSLYGVICKKFCMLLLHDHFGHMIVLKPSNDNSKITTSFSSLIIS